MRSANAGHPERNEGPAFCLRVGIVYFLALLSSPLHAQEAERVAGKIISSLDGHPLQNATLTLTQPKTNQVAASTHSDPEGRFSFDPVKPGKYRLQGAVRGYLNAAYLAHGQYSTAIVTGAGLETGSLTLRLTPAATISGLVTDDQGDPQRGATMQLYRAEPVDGGKIVKYTTTRTDDDGLYEFVNLPEGRFYLGAFGAPWYAAHPRAEPANGFFPYRQTIDPTVDVAYPTIFYPNATDSDGASPFNIHGGEQITANLQMQAQPAANLMIPINASQRPNERVVRLSQSVFGSEEPLNFGFTAAYGTQMLEGIPPGRYSLQEIGTGNQLVLHTQSVDLSGSSMTVNLPNLSSLATVSVSVRADDNAPLSPRPLIRLRGVNRKEATINAAPNPKNIVEFANLPEGDYDLSIEGRYTALQAIVGGKQLPHARIHVGAASTTQVDLTVAKSAPAQSVEGFAKADGKPAVATMVVLVPIEPGSHEDLFRRDQSDLDGSFTFANVAPGNYILIAIYDGWPLRWTDIPTITPYLLHGLPVSIAANAGSIVRLSEPIQPQSR